VVIVLAPATIDDFLTVLGRTGLLEESKVRSYLASLRAAGTLPGEPKELACALVRDGLLTHFQAQQILMGKARGFTISGKYKLLEHLGEGGMGAVYLCEHLAMRRRVAIKVLPAGRSQDASYLERFYREARAVAALDHPNIVRAHDIDHDDKLHFLVMEYVDGASLQEIVKKTGPMDVLRACHYVRQAALGLQHAHEAGLVHRDVKPGNILVDRNGIVKVLDMGLARFFHDDDSLSKKFDETVLGTTDYLAPEQAVHGDVDIRADIYSLGATFYYLLTGQTLFGEGLAAQKLIWQQTRQPKPLRSLRPAVPAELADLIERRMLAKDPARRFQVPAEAAAALEPWTQTPIPPPPAEEMPQLCPAAAGGLTPGAAVTPGPATTKIGWTLPSGQPESRPAQPQTTMRPRSPASPPPESSASPPPAGARPHGPDHSICRPPPPRPVQAAPPTTGPRPNPRQGQPTLGAVPRAAPAKECPAAKKDAPPSGMVRKKLSGRPIAAWAASLVLVAAASSGATWWALAGSRDNPRGAPRFAAVDTQARPPVERTAVAPAQGADARRSPQPAAPLPAGGNVKDAGSSGTPPDEAAAGATARTEPDLVVDLPRDYQVFQRWSRLHGQMLLRGRVRSFCDKVEVRIRGKSLEGPVPEKWQDVVFDAGDRHFETTLAAPAGGWFRVEVRALRGPDAVASRAIEHVGVGEVFVGAGGSGSTNCGEERLRPESGFVSTFDGSRWRPACDPQPGVRDRTGGGSFWPAFGDALYARCGVPIGVASTGQSGSSVGQWQKGGACYRCTMTRIEQLGAGGFRAVLWHQGEADVSLSADQYARLLRNVIENSKEDAGWEFPWFVAQASYLSPRAVSFPTVREGQKRLWDAKVALKGPDTDTLMGDYRDAGGKGIHFSARGLRAHGEMWADKVGAYLDRVLAGQ
jgi:serine/threonine protein kinase